MALTVVRQDDPQISNEQVAEAQATREAGAPDPLASTDGPVQRPKRTGYFVNFAFSHHGQMGEDDGVKSVPSLRTSRFPQLLHFKENTIEPLQCPKQQSSFEEQYHEICDSKGNFIKLNNNIILFYVE